MRDAYDRLYSDLTNDNPTEPDEPAEQVPESPEATPTTDGGVVPDDVVPEGSPQESTEPEPDCCESVDLAGRAGKAYQLDDGRLVRLDAGDKICSNCDTVHEGIHS